MFIQKSWESKKAGEAVLSEVQRSRICNNFLIICYLHNLQIFSSTGKFHATSKSLQQTSLCRGVSFLERAFYPSPVNLKQRMANFSVKGQSLWVYSVVQVYSCRVMLQLYNLCSWRAKAATDNSKSMGRAKWHILVFLTQVAEARRFQVWTLLGELNKTLPQNYVL